MADDDRAISLRWRSKYLSAANTTVPTLPGVYAIGHLDSLHGLELKRVYVYVGETQNLKNRLNQHLPDTEQNHGLRNYLRRNYAKVICWYALTGSSQTKVMEANLIRTIRPAFNAAGVSPTERKPK